MRKTNTYLILRTSISNLNPLWVLYPNQSHFGIQKLIIIKVSAAMMRHLFLFLAFMSTSVSFVCRKPTSLKYFARHRSPKLWKVHDVAMTPVRAHAISIDHTVLPPIIQPIQSVCGVSVITAALMYNFYQSSIRTPDSNVKSMGSHEKSRSIARSSKEVMSSFLIKHLPRITSFLKTRVDQCDPSLEQWNVCNLSHVEELSKEYDRYRFQIPSHADSRIKLDIAQEVRKSFVPLLLKLLLILVCVPVRLFSFQLLLCTVDAKGRTLKEGFFLASPPEALGYFDIVCKSGRQVPNDLSGLPLALQFLQEGEELAVKCGAKRLVLPRGDATSIAALSVLTSGMGILPTLQLLREVLSDARSSVQLVEVVWINDSKRDFILNAELEALELLHGHGEGGSGRLQVTRVVDREAGNANTLFSEQLRGAVSTFEAGTVAVVLAEDEAVALKASQLFSSLGYPDECIASLSRAKPV